ncbi:heme NO-binding domain-containing protein [Jannaschia marina]|uniref:heme NO-binding domain-containing protein n=1 Tax=Jannaschia marina TaxID=2741674 RepID=UPI0015C6C72C|nr:heme NO-binding domain-containing protein [Jannaschia marina]
MICKSLEGFVIDQCGSDAWAEVRHDLPVPETGFEALRSYDDALSQDVFARACAATDRSHDALLEDLGHWICVHPPLEPVRRLMRFSGTGFVDFLYALDEVPSRIRIALPGLEVPDFHLLQLDPGVFRIRLHWHVPGGGAFLTGVLRAMADDYGTLALIERADCTREDGGWHETLHVSIFDQAHQEPREFRLGASG